MAARTSSWGAAGLLLLATGRAHATISDPAFSETLFASKLGPTTAMAWAPDGSRRLFVTTKTGDVRVIEDGALLATPFATVSPLTTTSECGLLGLAFDPDFIQNGFVYFFATVSPSEQQILRYTATGNLGGDKTIVVAGLPTRGANHDGGALGFGPDGKLYWAVGDNGASLGIGNDLSLLNAKVGRANIDGSVPRDNPFVDGDGPNDDYVWARGFRNPFSMTFQPATGALWLNVVGTAWEQVFVPRAGDNGGYATYESNQPSAYLAPVISYPTNTVESHPIAASGTVRLGGTVTVYTTEAHRFRAGATLTIAGVTDSTFNGTFPTSAVLSPTQLSFQQAGPDATSGGGTVSSRDLGGCITGGAFWDSSGVPAAYRGNFIFGDYNSGKLIRATLDSNSRVTSVDAWGSGVSALVDVAIGPDGDLYYAPTSGSVYRVGYGFSAQALVVSQSNVRMAEGGKAAFGVRLALPPASPVVVSLAKTGDTDVAVGEGARMTFSPADWSVPQRVLLEAAPDSDSVEDVARVRVASVGLTTEDVNVRVTDTELNSFLLSTNSLQLEEGATTQFTVALSQPPPATLTVSVRRVDGDTDVEVSDGAQLTFTSATWSTPQTVTISAATDSDGAPDRATLRVAGSGPATREISVEVSDPESQAPSIVSEPPTSVLAGAGFVYDVDATGEPAPLFTLDESPEGMTIDPTSGLLAWLSKDRGSQSVVVRADNGISPAATQRFTIDVREPTTGAGGTSDGDPSAPAAASGQGGDDAIASQGGMGSAAPPAAAGETSAGEPGLETSAPTNEGGCGCKLGSASRKRPGALIGALFVALGMRRWRLRSRRNAAD